METLETIKFGQYHVLERMMKQPNFDFAKQKDLNFSGKNLTDTPPLRALKLLPSLLVIDFSHNLIDGFSTENLIRGAPLLEELNFSHNNITNLDSLIELGSLAHLKKLTFVETPVANRLLRIKILDFLLFPKKYKPHNPVKVLTATYQHVPDNSKIDSQTYEQTKQFYRFLERDIQEIPSQSDQATQGNKHNNKDSLIKLGLKPCPTPRNTRFPNLQILNNEIITVKDVCSILMVDNLDTILKVPSKEEPKINQPDEKSKKLHQEYLERYKKRHERKEDEENTKGFELIHEKEPQAEADELLILFKSDQAERDKNRVIKKNQSGKLWERPLDLEYKDAEYNISIKDHKKMLKDHEERKKKIIQEKKLRRRLYVEKVRALAKLDKKNKNKNKEKEFQIPKGYTDDKNNDDFDPFETDPEMKKLFGFKPKRKPKLSLDLGKNYSLLDSQESELDEGNDEEKSHASFSRTEISIPKKRNSEDPANISFSVANSPLVKNKKEKITLNTIVQLEDVKNADEKSSPNRSYKDSPGRVTSPFKKTRVMIRDSETFRSHNEAESIEPFVLDISKSQRLKKTFYVIKESTPNLSLPVNPRRDSKSPTTTRSSIKPKEEYNFVKKDNDELQHSARRSEWGNIETIPKTEVQNIYRGTEEGVDLTSVDFLAVMQASARGPESKITNELLKTEEPITFKNLQSQHSTELNVDQLNALFKGETKGLTFSNVTLSNKETHRPIHGLEKHPQTLQENYSEDDSQSDRPQTVDQEGIEKESEQLDNHQTNMNTAINSHPTGTPQPSPRDVQLTFDEVGATRRPDVIDKTEPARPLTANSRVVRVNNLETFTRTQTAAGHRRSNSKPENFASVLKENFMNPDILKKAMTPVLGSSASVKILNHKNFHAFKTKLQNKSSFKISNKIFYRHQKSASQVSLIPPNKSPAQSPVRKPNLAVKSARFEWAQWNTRKGSIEKNEEQADQSGAAPSIKNRRSSILTSEQVQQPLSTPQSHQRKIRYPSLAFEAASSRATVKGGHDETSTIPLEKTGARPLSHRKNYVKETPKIIVKKPLVITQSLAPENRVHPESLIPGPQDGVTEKMKLNLIQSKRGTFAHIVETAKMLDETTLLIQQAKEISSQVETVKSQRAIRYPDQIVHHDTIAEFLRQHNQVEKLSFEDNMKLKELVNLVNDFDRNKQVKLSRLAAEDKLREMKKKALTMEGKALEEMAREIIYLNKYLEIIEDIEAQRDIGKNTKQIHRMEMKEIERAETNAVLAAHYTKIKKYYGESHVNRFFKGHKEVLANMEANAQSGARIDFAHKVRKQNNSQGRAYNLGVYNEAELYPYSSKPKNNDSRDDIKKEELEPDWLTFTRVEKYVPKPMYTFEELTEMTMRKRNDQRNKAGHRVLTVEEKMIRYVEDLKEDAKKKKELKARIDKHIREGQKDIDEFLLTQKTEINKLYDKNGCFREYVRLIWENKI